MGAATLVAPPVGPADRLGLTLVVAVIVHVMLLLGVGFGQRGDFDVWFGHEASIGLPSLAGKSLLLPMHQHGEVSPRSGDGGVELQARKVGEA